MIGFCQVRVAFDRVEPNFKASPSWTKLVCPHVNGVEVPPMFTDAAVPNAENPPLPRLVPLEDQFTFPELTPSGRAKSADAPLPFDPPLISRTPPRNATVCPDTVTSEPPAPDVTR